MDVATEFAEHTDKVAHGYLPTYLRLAAELGPAARVCEVGVWHGGSLLMWQTLFPDGLIAGVDVDPGAIWPEGTRQVVSPQDAPDLPAMLSKHADAYELVVDDASHDGELSRRTFDLLWPLVAPGGYYVIEDWQTWLGHWPGYDDSLLITVQNLLKLLIPESDVESITYRYGLAILHKRYSPRAAVTVS
jgi:cephalosporin hydroxylase